MTDFSQIDNDETSNASFSSEDSQEPYFHVQTGKVFPAREAWGILAAEGHSRPSKHEKEVHLGGDDVVDSANSSANSALRTPKETEETTEIYDDQPPDISPPPPPTLSREVSETSSIQQTSSFGPTQSSIDKALHPESPNYISPNKKDIKNQTSISSEAELPPSESQDELEEDDPVILRAKAMALAAQNGQKLTAAQMQLIAQPDKQQQKLIEEAKRVQKAKDAAKAKDMQDQLLKQLSAPVDNLQRVGADFKKFIQTEKEKGAAPLQWGADLGKFIESQTSIRMGKDDGLQQDGAAEAEGGAGIAAKNEDDAASSKPSSSSLPPSAASSPKREKKKMEGFGTDPLAPHPMSPGPGSKHGPPDPSSAEVTPRPSLGKGSSMWPNMPPLPIMSDSITSMLPGVSGGNKGDVRTEEVAIKEPPVLISGILWKRRSGFGKHSTIKAWERRRVELKGSKLIYYRTQEEEEEDALAVASDTNNLNGNVNDASATLREPAISETEGESRESSHREDGDTTFNNNSSGNAPSDPTASLLSTKRYSSILGQAAQFTEQRLQTAHSSLKYLAASATGLESLRPSSADTPRGSLDLLREHASVSVSMGHSGAPTPFCLSIKVKGETKWKFCFDGHRVLMDWVAALTDVLVEASVEAKKEGGGVRWEMENYCIRKGAEEEHNSEIVAGDITALPTKEVVVTTATVTGVGGRTQQWMILGTNLRVAWALANVALILARSSSTSIDQYWMLLVFTNVGIWQLCARPEKSSLLRSNVRGSAISAAGSSSIKTKLGPSASSTLKTVTAPKENSDKPIAGNTTVRVAKVEDPNINENGDQLPSWTLINSSNIDVRSHGYLTTKKKIPSPGELYECVAVDCFMSDNRFPEIAPRVRLPDVKFDGDDAMDNSGKHPWKSPDIFIVSVSIPTEAPRFGQSTDDGPGLTMVGYFKMKDETRRILRRITNDGANPAATTDEALESETDVQKRISNGVRLWERYCSEAPLDPSFQARFKLIPFANLEELGCPSYIAKYNGKPVLIKRNRVTGFFDDHRHSTGVDVMEFDISLHPFPYLFKQATSYLKDYFDKTVASFGFVIEGRNDEELPEVVIGAMQVCYPSPKFTVNGEDFFGGTCPKSAARPKISSEDDACLVSSEAKK